SAVVTGVVVCDGSAAQCEERVVAAHADILAREDLGTSLAHQDGACQHDLTRVPLQPKPLGLAVASVARAAAAFLMRHRSPSSVDLWRASAPSPATRARQPQVPSPQVRVAWFPPQPPAAARANALPSALPH